MRGGIAQSRQLLENVKLIRMAESLGGVESLIEHPAIMTHASVPPQRRQELGIADSLVRLSVGVEAVDDILQDLGNALEYVDEAATDTVSTSVLDKAADLEAQIEALQTELAALRAVQPVASL